MQCPKCGSEVPESDYVCGSCGAYARSARNLTDDWVEATSLASSEGSDAAGPQAQTPFPPSYVLRQPPYVVGQPPYVVRQPPLGYPPGSDGPDFVHPTMHGWPGLAPPDWLSAGATDPAVDDYTSRQPVGRQSIAYGPQQGSLDALLAFHTRRAAKRWAKWSIALAVLAVVIPIVFGPIGFASGYIAWKLGERRLGSIGAALSAVGMILGILIAVAFLSLPAPS